MIALFMIFLVGFYCGFGTAAMLVMHKEKEEEDEANRR